MINDVTIIIPTRANLGYLQAAIASVRSQEKYDACKLLVGADNPTKEVLEWLSNNNKGNFDFVEFRPPTGKDRIGIVNIYEQLIKQTKTKFAFILHDDMVIGEFTIENLLNRWEPKTVLNSVRIEPPIYANTPEKILFELGRTAEEFNTQKFYELEKQIVTTYKDERVEGFFAPHFFAVNEWVGYDHLFEPQSREDSDLAQRFLAQGFKLYTVWDSVVYHFSGKGSRKKDGDKDSNEWQMSNYKNTRNYIRKWGTLNHTPHILPLQAPPIKISAHVLVGNEKELLFSFLEQIEPWFDEIVLVFDKEHTNSGVMEEYDRFVRHQLTFVPSNFSTTKFKTDIRELNNDFAAQTNHALQLCSNEWTMKLDVDEQFPEQLLSNLRFLIKEVLGENPNVTVIGLPRINLLDGKISNDIPREHWFTPEFEQYPNNNKVQNPDIQWRIHKKNEQWVGSVHEVPRSVRDNDIDRLAVLRQYNIIHPKSRQRQANQEQKYMEIHQGKKQQVNKYVYDSVIYTIEGITKHAVEEIKELDKRGKEIFLLDNNYRPIHGEQFKKFYTPFNWQTDNYIVIVNQPPERWNNSAHFKNRVGYLAFEGKLNKRWVKLINESNIMELWTPSLYCKKTFIESGVNKPIVIVPHGVNNEIFKPQSVEQFEEFTFLGIGTAHNNRKGLDLLAKAFSEEFKPEEKVKLLFKINKIYNPNESFNHYIKNYVNWNGNTNIEYCDENLTDEEMSELLNKAHVYVSTSRCEGFGINILNAMACGTPVVTTQGSGMNDFIDEGFVLKVDMDKEKWVKFEPPYENAKWLEPNLESLKKQLRTIYTEYSKFKKESIKYAPKIGRKWSWTNTVNTIEHRVDDLSKR